MIKGHHTIKTSIFVGLEPDICCIVLVSSIIILLPQVDEDDAIFLPDFEQNEVNKFIHDVYKSFTRCGYVEIAANFDLV